VGVHGDSQVVAWSDATIAGIPINESLPLSTFNRDELSSECKNRSRIIIQEKGSTPLGIGFIIYSICSSILSDKRNVRPISHFQPEWGCCVSLPVVLGRAGIIKKIQMPLNNEERAALDESVKDLRTKFERINEDQ
jgi:L-lactate dehydrogenase